MPMPAPFSRTRISSLETQAGGRRCCENPLSRVSREGGICGAWQFPSSLEGGCCREKPPSRVSSKGGFVVGKMHCCCRENLRLAFQAREGLWWMEFLSVTQNASLWWMELLSVTQNASGRVVDKLLPRKASFRSASGRVVVAVKTTDLRVTISLISIWFNKQEKMPFEGDRTKAHSRCDALVIRQWHGYSRGCRNANPYPYPQGYCTCGYGYIPPRVLRVSTGKGTPAGTLKLYYK